MKETFDWTSAERREDIADQWKNLTFKQKSKYVKMARSDRNRYYREKTALQKEQNEM